jgi:nicotinate-nucleotide adenylyltransferase
MKIGLFFGSFNPIHIGHLALANYFVEFTDLDKIWFVVSPQNPFKKRSSLLSDYHRLYMVNLAIEESPRKYSSSNIEFNMPKPSYTIDTLIYLEDKYPHYDFVLIMGADNLKGFHKWKNYELIADKYQLYVYPRIGYDFEPENLSVKYTIVDAPRIEISSSFIRKSIFEGKDVSFFMHPKVANFIDEMNFYKK